MSEPNSNSKDQPPMKRIKLYTGIDVFATQLPDGKYTFEPVLLSPAKFESLKFGAPAPSTTSDIPTAIPYFMNRDQLKTLEQKLTVTPFVNFPEIPPETDKPWEKFYRELCIFLRDRKYFPPIHGSPLGEWCKKQRMYKRNGTIPEDREKRLNKIGFIWNPPINNPKWENMVEQLKKFHKENGNWRVSDEPMRWWMGIFHIGCHSDFQGKQRQDKENTKLPLDRLVMLNEMEFPWDSMEEVVTTVQKDI